MATEPSKHKNCYRTRVWNMHLGEWGAGEDRKEREREPSPKHSKLEAH